MREPTRDDSPSSETTEDEPGAGGTRGKTAGWGIFWLTPEERFDALEPGAIFGRSVECRHRLDGSGVSRRHAVVQREGPVWSLRDLTSRNGTYVNGSRREFFPLSEQDTLRVGEWVGVVCRAPEADPPSALFHTLQPDLIVSAQTLAALGDPENMARSDIPIIVQGETGAGKEVLVRALHAWSKRSGPLIAVNCAAVPESLAEGQLFGHKRGAFTGAIETSQGYVAAADRGTLLLDEIVELPLGVQSKLLRVLEDRSVTPLGCSQPTPVDFRLIATTQEPLAELVRKGEFRADLYARLSGLELQLPPLRHRRQEVVRLLRHVMGAALATVPQFDARMVERLCRYAWPYNVRELVQLGRLLAASGRARYDITDLPERFDDAEMSASSGAIPPEPSDGNALRRHAWLARHAKEFERLKRALEASRGNLSEAARRAGIPRYRARRLLAAEASLSEH